MDVDTFDNEEGEEYEASGFGGFNDYFRRKKIKLQNLDVELRARSTDNTSIFRGVVAHVNGYTQPSLNDLHHMIVSNGGGFMQYLDGKTTVTHIIASNLTPKKKVEFRRYRIVKPAWVVESIRAGKLLPWNDFRVVDEGRGQKVLALKNGSVSSEVNTQQRGYRDQTSQSWYTAQLKEAGNDRPSLSSHQHSMQPEDSDDDRMQYDTTKLKSDTIIRLPPHELAAERVSASPELLPPAASPSPSDSFLSEHEDDQAVSSPDDVDSLSKAENKKAGTSPGKEHLTAEEHNSILLSDPRIWKSSVLNPGFLKQYYQESRLHHLSAWKAELKAQLQKLTAETSSQPAKQKRVPGARRYVLHVDFDSFFAAISLKSAPELVDKPAVVAHGSGLGSEIASCNYPARKFGVKNGMWMKRAIQLCPELKVLPYDFKAYEEASKTFYQCILGVGGIVQSVSVDEALIDVSVTCIAAGGTDGRRVGEGSVRREQDKAEEIALSLREQIKDRTGCAVSIGIGGSILLAKVALRKAKPAGQYHLKPEDVLDFIGSLPVQDLPGVAHSIGGKLEDVGVKLVKDIRDLSKERLISVLGPKTGEKIWDYSRGIDRTEVGEQVVRKSVSAEVNWGVRFETQEQVEEFITNLCEELHQRLVKEGVRGRQLTMKIMRRAADAPLDPPKHLGHGKCDTYNKSIAIGVLTNQAEVLGREALSILNGFKFSPGDLRGIGVQMTKLEPLKNTGDAPEVSSQKRLQFKTPGFGKPMKKADPAPEDPIVDDIESPHKQTVSRIHPAAALTDRFDDNSKPLNTLGTQFIIPSQIDLEVLAELPDDIRSMIQAASKATTHANTGAVDVSSNYDSASNSRSASPGTHYSADSPPRQSQLDPEVLASLPEDVRREVVASYASNPVSKPRGAQTLLPQSPRKVRALKTYKKPSHPTKKRGGGLFSKRSKAAPNLDGHDSMTLTQSNFIATRSTTRKAPTSADTAPEPISEDFLQALPEELRAEVLTEHRRSLLSTRAGLNIPKNRKGPSKPPTTYPPRLLRLPPRPPRPSFTTRKLSALPDLREAVRTWVEEFAEEGPFIDDVEALARYLGRVVVEERDLGKAVAVVRWLEWVIGQVGARGLEAWREGLGTVTEAVQTAVRERGLGPVQF